ncbi:hypothetical protein M885DRAFT_624347 [Pelagophyceae sp. CCMP2097]|nr:hypothetical protein M885DRAFT_624347 [Pelagophyceae sp. CCMP2097]
MDVDDDVGAWRGRAVSRKFAGLDETCWTGEIIGVSIKGLLLVQWARDGVPAHARWYGAGAVRNWLAPSTASANDAARAAAAALIVGFAAADERNASTRTVQDDASGLRWLRAATADESLRLPTAFGERMTMEAEDCASNVGRLEAAAQAADDAALDATIYAAAADAASEAVYCAAGETLRILLSLDDEGSPVIWLESPALDAYVSARAIEARQLRAARSREDHALDHAVRWREPRAATADEWAAAEHARWEWQATAAAERRRSAAAARAGPSLEDDAGRPSDDGAGPRMRRRPPRRRKPVRQSEEIADLVARTLANSRVDARREAAAAAALNTEHDDEVPGAEPLAVRLAMGRGLCVGAKICLSHDASMRGVVEALPAHAKSCWWSVRFADGLKNIRLKNLVALTDDDDAFSPTPTPLPRTWKDDRDPAAQRAPAAKKRRANWTARKPQRPAAAPSDGRDDGRETEAREGADGAASGGARNGFHIGARDGAQDGLKRRRFANEAADVDASAQAARRAAWAAAKKAQRAAAKARPPPEPPAAVWQGQDVEEQRRIESALLDRAVLRVQRLRGEHDAPAADDEAARGESSSSAQADASTSTDDDDAPRATVQRPRRVAPPKTLDDNERPRRRAQSKTSSDGDGSAAAEGRRQAEARKNAEGTLCAILGISASSSSHGALGGSLAGRLGENKFVARYAPQGRCKCQERACRRRIEKGQGVLGKRRPALRLGHDPRIKWYHIECLFQSFGRVCYGTKTVTDAADIEDLDVLSDAHRARVLQCIARARADRAAREGTRRSARWLDGLAGRAAPEALEAATARATLLEQRPGAGQPLSKADRDAARLERKAAKAARARNDGAPPQQARDDDDDEADDAAADDESFADDGADDEAADGAASDASSDAAGSVAGGPLGTPRRGPRDGRGGPERDEAPGAAVWGPASPPRVALEAASAAARARSATAIANSCANAREAKRAAKRPRQDGTAAAPIRLDEAAGAAGPPSRAAARAPPPAAGGPAAAVAPLVVRVPRGNFTFASARASARVSTAPAAAPRRAAPPPHLGARHIRARHDYAHQLMARYLTPAAPPQPERHAPRAATPREATPREAAPRAATPREAAPRAANAAA